MKKKIFFKASFFAYVLILLLPVAIADEAEDAFYTNPTSETFQDYAYAGDASAEDLLIVEDATIEDFQLLSKEEQARYLLMEEGYSSEFAQFYVEEIVFSEASASDFAIAETFFTENADNINNNPYLFRDYLLELGITLEIDEGVGVTGYSSEGWLEGTNGGINIKDFKKEFNFRILENGEILLFAYTKPYTFSGDISKNSNGGLMLMGSGQFGGFETRDIYDLRIDSQGNIHCTAQQFESLEFVQDKSSLFIYNPTTKRYTLKDAYLERFPNVPITGTIGIEGKHVKNYPLHVIPGAVIPIEKGSDSLFVGKGDEVYVGGVKVKNEDANYVYLRFDSDPEKKYVYDPESIIPITEESVNEVIFSSDGTIQYYSAERSMKQGKGGGYSIEVSNLAMLQYAEYFECASLQYEGYCSVPEEGFSLVEESPAVVQVQQYLHLTESGIYDEATQAAVKQWQKQYNLNHPDTTIRKDGILDRETRDRLLEEADTKNLVIQPRGSYGVIYNGRDALSVDNTGPVEMNMEKGQVTYNGLEIKGEVSTLTAGLPLMIHIYSEETENMLVDFKRDMVQTVCTTGSEEGVENTIEIYTLDDAEYASVASMYQKEGEGSEYSGELIYAEENIPYLPEEIRGDLHATLSYFSVPDAEHWGDVISTAADQFVEEFDLPEGYDRYIERYIASEITQESNFGDAGLYFIEYLADNPLTAGLVGTKGYGQVDIARITEAAAEVDAELPYDVGTYVGWYEMTQALHTPEGAAEYNGRYIALLVDQYVYEQDLNPDDPHSVEIVAAAYNAGRYTPRNAQIQQMLNDLGYESQGKPLKTDGTLGDISKGSLRQYARDKGLDPDVVNTELEYTSDGSFESSTVYTTLSQEWMERTGSPYTYARVPDARSAAQPVSQYASSVSHIYQRFTEE